jgi:transglutaminase-like putative cysteine protease
VLRRTLLVSLVPAAVVTAAWLRMEDPLDRPYRPLLVVLLALVPALVRPLVARAAAVLVMAVFAGWIAFGVSPARTWHVPGALLHRLVDGSLDFYDVRTPFDPRIHVEMRGAVLAAIFGFVVAISCAVAARRPLVASVLLLVGAGWPATLRGASGALVIGVAMLLAVLVLLAGLTSRYVPRAVVPAAAAVALLAVAASTSAAVAKSGVVAWQRWDPYNAPQPPVSVSFIWNADYGGISFPAKRTTVLEVKAPHRSLYWRAAVLDVFDRDRWLEGDPRRGDALVPDSGKPLLRQDVRVLALSDTRLVGASVPIRYDAGDAPLRSHVRGIAELPQGLTRNFRYTAWSYAPQPTPAELRASKPVYPIEIVEPETFLDVAPSVAAPPFGARDRARRVIRLIDAHKRLASYAPLARTAFQVAGVAQSPYDAAAALERWFRTTGGFTYSNHPAIDPNAPLVGFVVQTKSGYCQHFAGAMALMLRYLGVPARVAVGFSSGTYDFGKGVWRVTDHDAHAWVEAWFRGYGWLPFDPTPAGRPERGQLSAPYAAARRFAATSIGGSAAPSGSGETSGQGAHRHGEQEGTGVKTFGGTSSSSSSWGHSLILLLLLLAGAAAAGIVLTKLVARRARYLSRDPRRVAAACRQELADYLLDQHIDAARSATLHELGAIVRHELMVDPDAFVAAATAARFGPPEGAGGAARLARRELRALLRRMRVRLRTRDRVRGLLSLRSFGFAP